MGAMTHQQLARTSKQITIDHRQCTRSACPPFSTEATDVLGARLAEYEHDLGELSMIAASRENDNLVSAHHVDRAAQFLVSRPRDRVAQSVRDIGGVAMGTGSGAMIAFAATDTFGVWFAVSLVVTLVGTAMFFRHSR
jgi:hypothetical protein